MSQVVLTHSYFYRRDPKQWRSKQPYPPLGTMLAAGVIRDLGLTLSFFDSNLRHDPAELTPLLLRTNPRYLIVYDDGFNYLTKMCLTVMREAAFVMAKAGKEMGCTVIVSSSDAADHAKKYFEHGADYVIRGEGEDTLRELLTTLEADGDPSAIAGLAFCRRDEVVLTQPRKVLRHLDALPLPAWDLPDLAAYKKIWQQHHGYFSLNIATTRGCPYKCNWCAKPIYGNRYNSRSPQQVADEIEHLLQAYQPGHFWVCDDIFGLKAGWVREFRNIVVQRKLSFRYKIQSRVDLLLEEDTVRDLAESGVETVWVGAESGSQKILDAMDKGTTVDQIRRATQLLRQHGVRVGFFLQFGYTGETWADIEATLAMVLDLMPDEIGISVSYPLPGTKFYDNIKASLQEKQNWSDSDDLAMMFHGTYSSAFYKVLHRYVHNRYRLQRGINLIKQVFRRPAMPAPRQLRKIMSMIYHFPFSIANAYQLKKMIKSAAIHGTS
jgi:anaerobic magnesium-protoporphyrin IX monomethyl ester cyclase